VKPTFHIENVGNPAGIAASAAKGGEKVRVLYREALTSDDPRFYKFMESVTACLLGKCNVTAHSIHQFLILIHDDLSGDFYLNNLPIQTSIMVKGKVEKGQMVLLDDIADIRDVRFDGIEIKPRDRVICCIKVWWKFGLYFDFEAAHDPKSQLDVGRLSKTLGSLYRYLLFEHVYKTMAAKERFERMQTDGWFPFVELLGSEFKELANAYEYFADPKDQVDALVAKFDSRRVEKMTERWWAKQAFSDKRSIVQAGINAYLRGDSEGHILCLKALLPEIEGILRSLHYSEKGTHTSKLNRLTEHLGEKALAKIGSEASLLLPASFVHYLQAVVFRNFDLTTGDVSMSRHSATHGVAPPEQYTKVRALQALLSLDQIYFYL
jgi:hypothetical protein